MIDVPIVIVNRRDDKTLEIVCPHCGRHHCHGSGGNGGPYVGTGWRTAPMRICSRHCVNVGTALAIIWST